MLPVYHRQEMATGMSPQLPRSNRAAEYELLFQWPSTGSNKDSILYTKNPNHSPAPISRYQNTQSPFHVHTVTNTQLKICSTYDDMEKYLL